MLVRLHLILRDPVQQRRLRRLVAAQGAIVTAEPANRTLAEALATMAGDLVVLRESLAEGGIGGVVEALRAHPDRPELVILTSSAVASHRSDLLGQGARAVLGEADSDQTLEAALGELVAARAARMRLEHQARAGSRYGTLRDFSSQSPSMTAFDRLVRKVIPSNTTILIEGETGVGKERLARVIHHEGPRQEGPFVAVNCAAIPDALIESELFGHERGAFTDAVRQKRGKFELAHGGTIFLDEVGDLPLHLQAKLLRVLQEREIERVGGEEALPVDVRVIAATNTDLRQAVDRGRFRSDLFFRLAVVVIAIPPLRERPEDVPALARRYVEHFGTALKKPDSRLGAAAIDALVHYPWPGNVRELINVIERAVLLCEQPVIEPEDLADCGTAAAAPMAATPAPLSRKEDHQSFEDLLALPWIEARGRLLETFERRYLEQALERSSGRIGSAARIMGVNPRSLYDKMQRFGIDKRAFQQASEEPGARGGPAAVQEDPRPAPEPSPEPASDIEGRTHPPAPPSSAGT